MSYDHSATTTTVKPHASGNSECQHMHMHAYTQPAWLYMTQSGA